MVTLIEHALVQDKLSRLRMKSTRSAEFRRLVRELAGLLVYEVTRDLPVRRKRIETPLGPAEGSFLKAPLPCLVSVLRAGNGLIEPMADVLPGMPIGHVGMERDERTLAAREYYANLPEDIGRRLAIVADPMLATGNTAVAVLDRLKAVGAKQIRLVCLVAAPDGLVAVGSSHPDVSIYTAAVDERLNEDGYIVPGLGDAGDRLYAGD